MERATLVDNLAHQCFYCLSLIWPARQANNTFLKRSKLPCCSKLTSLTVCHHMVSALTRPQWINTLGKTALPKLVGYSFHKMGIHHWLVKLFQKIFNSLWPSDTIWWHRSGSTLAHVMGSCLMVTNHPNYCWLFIKGILWHLSESNVIRSTHCKTFHVLLAKKCIFHNFLEFQTWLYKEVYWSSHIFHWSSDFFVGHHGPRTNKFWGVWLKSANQLYL